MMTASVAMGVAVDDTIHFLTWFRNGIRAGRSRQDAILQAYRRVAMAMTQTTIIGGLGLSVFMISTFTPTQRFGTLMLTLLAAALVGDLILLPALLAGRWGEWFCPPPAATELEPPPTDDPLARTPAQASATLHSPLSPASESPAGAAMRIDQPHAGPGDG